VEIIPPAKSPAPGINVFKAVFPIVPSAWPTPEPKKFDKPLPMLEKKLIYG
jgi:hypothetical protein